MTAKRRNDELVNLLRGDFFARSEPNAAWVHFQSAIMQLCGLKGYWPMSAIHNTGANILADDIACGHDLQLAATLGTPIFGYMDTATQTAFPPWCSFASASAQYLTFGADDSQHDILGTETHISANERGLTLGGWFKFTTVPASIFGMMSKFYNVGDQRAYTLFKTAANNIGISISSLGTAASTITQSSAGVATVAADIWYFCVGRFKPSTELAVFVDNVPAVGVAGIPASIFNSSEPFEIGRLNRTTYLNGKASNCFLCASYLSDSILTALWEQSRVMYGKEG